MKFASALFLLCALAVHAQTPRGIDVTQLQGNINWAAVKKNGVSFAYIKATQGKSAIDPVFQNQFANAATAGIIRGAYHSARPNESKGAVQANFLVSNGGRWAADGKTLPAAVELSGTCYSLTQSAMVAWITDFSTTYTALTGRAPVIYTSAEWWKLCTGNSVYFGKRNPLWVAKLGSSPTPLPAGWKAYTFWQNAEKGTDPGRQDVFVGSISDLQKFADNK